MIACLFADGTTRAILRSGRFRWFAPGWMPTEVLKHAGPRAKKKGLNQAQVGLLIAELLARIELVPVSILEPFDDAAVAALAHVDADDVPYLAFALAVEADAIWSHDPHFDAQTLVPRITNADLLRLL